MVTTRVKLNELKSKKQLRKLSFQEVIHAGFTDETERYFEIEFKMPNGTIRELAIYFDDGKPRVFVSAPFSYGNC